MFSSEFKAAIVKPAPLIYCGPTLPRGILNQHTVYRGGLPRHLGRHFEACPSIKRLFVSAENMAKTMQAIKRQGSAESVWFEQVLDYFRGGAK
jgi:hypothetical protein